MHDEPRTQQRFIDTRYPHSLDVASQYYFSALWSSGMDDRWDVAVLSWKFRATVASRLTGAPQNNT